MYFFCFAKVPHMSLGLGLCFTTMRRLNCLRITALCWMVTGCACPGNWLKTASDWIPQNSDGRPGTMIARSSWAKAPCCNRRPVRAMTGITDAKTVDYQAGFETMQNLMMGMLPNNPILTIDNSNDW